MAKTTAHKDRSTATAPRHPLAVDIEGGTSSTLASYAEALGTAMGNLRNRVDDWQGQRAQLIKQLSTMVTDAQGLLADLGHTAADRIGRLRRGRRRTFTPVDANPAGALRPTKRTKRGLTEAGRAAISAAQKRRWAQYKNKRVPK